MSKDYFQSTLADFTSDVASGDAIRHLADLGYSVDEIHERLDFPTPKEKIASVVWKHLVRTGVICLEEPGKTPREKVSYVKEYDSFGRTSFRQVREKIDPEDTGRKQPRYVECDFGIRKYKDKEAFEKSLVGLELRDKDYILSLPWPIQKVWHLNDERMRRIQEIL